MTPFIKNYWALITGAVMLLLSLCGFALGLNVAHTGGTPTWFTVCLAAAVIFMVAGITAVDVHIKNIKE